MSLKFSFRGNGFLVGNLTSDGIHGNEFQFGNGSLFEVVFNKESFNWKLMWCCLHSKQSIAAHVFELNLSHSPQRMRLCMCARELWLREFKSNGNYYCKNFSSNACIIAHGSTGVHNYALLWHFRFHASQTAIINLALCSLSNVSYSEKGKKESPEGIIRAKSTRWKLKLCDFCACTTQQTHRYRCPYDEMRSTGCSLHSRCIKRHCRQFSGVERHERWWRKRIFHSLKCRI